MAGPSGGFGAVFGVLLLVGEAPATPVGLHAAAQDRHGFRVLVVSVARAVLRSQSDQQAGDAAVVGVVSGGETIPCWISGSESRICGLERLGPGGWQLCEGFAWFALQGSCHRCGLVVSIF